MFKSLPVEPVKLIAGLIYSANEPYLATLEQLEKKFGKIEIESEIFPFNQTDYYEKEMGKDLKRGFVAFVPPIRPDKLKEAKLAVLKIEDKFLTDSGRRTINIDPGILGLANLILASSKDYAHRIYLGDGVYGEVTMIYRDRAFRVLPWTYPDYQRTEMADFLLRVRNSLKEKIISLRNR